MESTVNQRVLLLKKELDLSNSEFCLKAKISTGTLYTIQNGVQMKSKTINAFCEAFNLNKEWLLHGKGNMFAETPKVDVINAVDPWKDALVMQVKEENNRLIEQVRWLQQMVSQFTNGVKPNFLKASENAYDFMFHLPGVNKYANVSGANHA